MSVAALDNYARWPGLSAAKPRALLAWVTGAVLSVYLGLSGGGYDIVVRSELGLIVWWVVLLGGMIGCLPRRPSQRVGWIAGALLACFLIWTWMGLTWTSSHELTLDEVCRVSTYLGVFVLGLCTLRQDSARPLLAGLGFGIALVSCLAVLSKLLPALFPADTAASFYADARLSYPFDYADGVGEYAALGIPLLVFLATSSRTLTARALATGGIQLLLLCLALTVSRGGILAAGAGIFVLFALVPDRISRLPTLAISAVGIAVLMLALLSRAALRDSVAAAPAVQRHSMLVILLAVIVGTSGLQVALQKALSRRARPPWMVISRDRARTVAVALLACMIALVLIALATGTVGRMWNSFKVFTPTAHTNQYFRLFSLSGSHRYQYWQVAWNAFKSSVLHGIGPGTYRLYWEQHTTYSEYVLNAHSLWFETLAETGLVGWALVAGFFVLILGAGARLALRAGIDIERRLAVATATAGVASFCAAASFDWVWQIGVVPMVTMLLAALVFMPSGKASEQPAASGPRAYPIALRRLAGRAAAAAGALLAMALITIPLASTVALRKSQSDAAHGRLAAALDAADTAASIEPGAASPYLQRALVLELGDDIAGAGAAISAAIRREPGDYELWLIASRIATEADRPRQATADFERARRLYPTSSISAA